MFARQHGTGDEPFRLCHSPAASPCHLEHSTPPQLRNVTRTFSAVSDVILETWKCHCVPLGKCKCDTGEKRRDPCRDAVAVRRKQAIVHGILQSVSVGLSRRPAAPTSCRVQRQPWGRRVRRRFWWWWAALSFVSEVVVLFCICRVSVMGHWMSNPKRSIWKRISKVIECGIVWNWP